MRNMKFTIPMMRGDDVEWVQQRLIAHGHDPGIADGIFGSKTGRAVRAFQAKHLLDADGIVGPLTRAALTENPSSGKGTAILEAFLDWLRVQVGHIYVWGAQGEAVTSEGWIAKMETSVRNTERARRLYRKRQEEGKDPIKAYDCSGLIMCWLNANGIYSYDMSSASLYNKCVKLTRDELRPGDLVFRHNGIRIYHVGVYMGGGEVIEAKGRDDGVVLRDINASGTKYWNRYGRLERLSGE